MRRGSGGVAQATQRENAFGFDSACLGCSVGVGYLGICVSAVGPNTRPGLAEQEQKYDQYTESPPFLYFTIVSLYNRVPPYSC